MECPKCGEKLYDMAEFCDACGCDLRQHRSKRTQEVKVYSGEEQGFVEFQSGTPLDAGHVKKKKRDKKSIAISLVLVISLILVFVVVGAFVHRNTYTPPYEKKVADLMDLMNGEITTLEGFMEALFPKFFCEDYEALMKAQCEDEGLDYEEEIRDANTSITSKVENVLRDNGLNYEFSYHIKSERRLGEAELKDISESYTTASQILNVLTTTGEAYKAENKIKTYEAYMKLIEDLSTVECTDGYEMDIEFVAENHNGEEESSERVKIIVVKIQGDWMIDFMHYKDELSTMLK